MSDDPDKVELAAAESPLAIIDKLLLDNGWTFCHDGCGGFAPPTDRLEKIQKSFRGNTVFTRGAAVMAMVWYLEFDAAIKPLQKTEQVSA